MAYPNTLKLLIEQFTKFPGIGEKSAQRFVFHLLRQPSSELVRLAKLIMSLHESVVICAVCQNYADHSPCTICASQGRDHAVICVVAHSHEVAALEKTRVYKGVYHVLGGTLNILDGVTPDKLKIRELVGRLSHPHRKIREVVLAFNPDLEGESTVLYLGKLLRQYSVIISRLARGLPRGADIDYADEVTLGEALRARREIERSS